MLLVTSRKVGERCDWLKCDEIITLVTTQEPTTPNFGKFFTPRLFLTELSTCPRVDYRLFNPRPVSKSR